MFLQWKSFEIIVLEYIKYYIILYLILKYLYIKLYSLLYKNDILRILKI
jgi:hypothetical protein